MKTTSEILTWACNLLSSSPINNLNGGIYKKTRPTGSILNDCVVSIIPGVMGKFIHDGALIVKLFYPTIAQSNSFFEDSTTGNTYEKLLFDVSQVFITSPGLSFYENSREIYTESYNDMKESYAVLRINFKNV